MSVDAARLGGDDMALVARALRRLPADEAEAVLEAIAAPAWFVRRSRLDVRDVGIRGALEAIGACNATDAARLLASAWQRYIAGPEWRDDRARGISPDAGPLREALYRISLHNAGGALCWRQIVNISDGHRG